MVDLPKSRSSFQTEHTQRTDPSFQGRDTLIKPTRQTYKTTIPQTIITSQGGQAHINRQSTRMLSDEHTTQSREVRQDGHLMATLNGIRLTWPDESTPQKEWYSPQYQINPQQFPSTKGRKVLSTGQRLTD